MMSPVRTILNGVVLVTGSFRAYDSSEHAALLYDLKDTYQGHSFFDRFNYFSERDPTKGFVHYVPKEQAESLWTPDAHQNLTYASSDSAILRVDTSVGPNDEPNASTGRSSVRIESKDKYESGLFIFDIKHAPYGCGTWPALWLTDHHNWPDHGEIDVMETVNQAEHGHQMTLHTTKGCTMDVNRQQTGLEVQTDCDWGTNSNAGCGVKSLPNEAGNNFNMNGGGIMAVEWRDEGIRMWQFPRGSIPSDIQETRPDPNTWGTALADFPNTNCDMGDYFKNQSIVVNIALCGDLVNAVWGDSGCPGTCQDLVANSPEAFENAYWEFGSFRVYQAN
ncbi:hypothetical protein F66182_1381 [Fusarium sp. NRRL 66182]|nr:hypothetical protein F66182_1381 [Fusarium sp. NRRL 66182]